MRIFKAPVSKFFSQRTTLGEFLQKLTKLPEQDLADAAQKGAVWIQRNAKGKTLRIRGLKEQVGPQDLIQCFYDPKVLKLPAVTESECLYEDQNYGIWIKAAGVVPQGSQAGDHASLLRYVEIARKKEVFLVHRLDRETEGPMIVGYNSKAAGVLGDLFQKNLISKTYEAIVLGEMEVGSKQTIKASLDDKEAITHIEVLASKNNQSHLKVTIETGRLHQIRRHLDFIGHPIMGDPKYGRGNKNREGLKLVAVALSFQDPWLKKIQNFQYPSKLTV
ncbi:RluA family pseudouridine synthase [Peredibacter sp. HCB2-198]|uniref:RluA family pseudouridine synthase n=1 Tax=Peredibacter sp. HCB2-198 TaxID=3383025 RepID=UPI0038B461A8